MACGSLTHQPAECSNAGHVLVMCAASLTSSLVAADSTSLETPSAPSVKIPLEIPSVFELDFSSSDWPGSPSDLAPALRTVHLSRSPLLRSRLRLPSSSQSKPILPSQTLGLPCPLPTPTALSEVLPMPWLWTRISFLERFPFCSLGSCHLSFLFFHYSTPNAVHVYYMFHVVIYLFITSLSHKYLSFVN